MRTMRKLTLLALSTAAAMALAAGPASAVEVRNETIPPTHCGPVTVTAHVASGGCLINAVSTAPVELRGLLGAMFTCDNVFTARVDEAGKGWIYNQQLLAPGTQTPCTVQPCKEPNGVAIEWRIEVTQVVPTKLMEAQFCVTVLGQTINCHLAGLTITQTSHTTGNVTTGGATHKFCEASATNAVLGTWNITSPAPGLEIT